MTKKSGFTVYLEKQRNWRETFYEVVAAIEQSKNRGSCTPKLITEIQDQQGHCGFYDLAIKLTDEFEKLNEGRQWDGEFFDEIDNFMAHKLI